MKDQRKPSSSLLLLSREDNDEAKAIRVPHSAGNALAIRSYCVFIISIIISIINISNSNIVISIIISITISIIITTIIINNNNNNVFASFQLCLFDLDQNCWKHHSHNYCNLKFISHLCPHHRHDNQHKDKK